MGIELGERWTGETGDDSGFIFQDFDIVTATTYSDSYTCGLYNTLTLYIEYNQNNETGVRLRIEFCPFQTPVSSQWYAETDTDVTDHEIVTHDFEATGNYRIVFSINDPWFRIGVEEIGGPGTGTVSVKYCLGN